jgi:putative tricarboxylic transport membrane protein
MLHGMRPGYELFTVHAPTIYAFIMSMMVAALLVTLIGSFGSFFFARIINIPSRFLAPAIVFMTVLGSYSIRNNMLDVWIMFSFGIIGYVSNKLRFHPAPIVLGLILGPFVEEGLVQSMLAGRAAGGVIGYMVFRPISIVLIGLCIMSASLADLCRLAGAPQESGIRFFRRRVKMLNTDLIVGFSGWLSRSWPSCLPGISDCSEKSLSIMF